MATTDEQRMQEAAEQSMVKPICMFCGEQCDPESLVEQEDWNGNRGRACPTCADQVEAE
ncbi:MAG: hypothetical protein IMZ62_12775 [Chloroflexi bacterium]|nr:hypothetical protein [Chloroflexota bacterium]